MLKLPTGPVSHFARTRFQDAGTIAFAADVRTDPLAQVVDEQPQAGTIYGTGLNDIIGGTPEVDVIYGYGGNDLINGFAGDDTIDGGTENDRMYGGLGNDTFYVDTQGDVVFEFAGEGNDTIVSPVSFYLYANVEVLILTGTGDFYGVGNPSNNEIRGNSGHNLLLGGDGTDTLRGEGGNDSLYGESGNDSVWGGAGVDYIAGGEGNDVLRGEGDADAIYGEDGADVLYAGDGFVTDILVGGAGNDILYGASGLGDYDLLDGDSGDDIYWVDSGDDHTFEDVGGGYDTVFADVRVPNGGVYLYANVERLVLVGTTAFGVGNELNNRLDGSGSANWLLGGAGDDIINGDWGNDVLFGEAGADTFVFGIGTGGDVIGDFQIGVDRIDISEFDFTSFSQLSANFVQNGAHGAINLGGGDFIVLHNVTMSQLTAADFIVAAPASSPEGAAAADLPEWDSRFSRPYVPAAEASKPTETALDPQVLIGAQGDDFLLKAGDELGPQINPGIDDPDLAKVFAEGPQVLPGDEGFTGPNHSGLEGHLAHVSVPDQGVDFGFDDPFVSLNPAAWHS